MSLPTTEFFFFKASDAFRADPIGIASKVFDVASTKAGCQTPGYAGIQIDESETRKAEGLTYDVGYSFLNWDSWQAHKDVIDGPDYLDVISSVLPALATGDPVSSGAVMYHLESWNSAPKPALQSKVTEVLILDLKAPENRARVEEILTGLSDAAKGLLVFSKAKETPDTYVVIAGWDSCQHHWDTIKAPEIDEKVQELYSFAPKQNNHLFHTELQAHTPK